MGVCVNSCSAPSISCPAHSVLSDARGHHVPTHTGSFRNPDSLTSAGSSRTSQSIWDAHPQIPANSCSTSIVRPQVSSSQPLLDPLSYRKILTPISLRKIKVLQHDLTKFPFIYLFCYSKVSNVYPVSKEEMFLFRV